MKVFSKMVNVSRASDSLWSEGFIYLICQSVCFFFKQKMMAHILAAVLCIFFYFILNYFNDIQSNTGSDL